MSLLMNSKRGSMFDIFGLIVILFIAAMFIFAVGKAVLTVDSIGLFDDDPTANETFQKAKQGILAFDNVLLILLMGLSLYTIISSYFVWNHPAFFFIGFIVLCIAIVIAGHISNAVEIVGSNLPAVATAFPKMIFLFQQLPYYLALMGILLLIVSFLGYKDVHG